MENQDISKIDIEALAHSSGELSGQLTLEELPRLADFCTEPLPEEVALSNLVASWGARGEVKEQGRAEPQIWLYLQAKVELPLVCERCLKPVMKEVEFDYAFRFVATEEQAIREDDESEEVVLALSHTFDLKSLCEDELIMALPYMPLHELCEEPLVEGLDQSGLALELVDDDFNEASEKANPFAVLEALKKNKH